MLINKTHISPFRQLCGSRKTIGDTPPTGERFCLIAPECTNPVCSFVEHANGTEQNMEWTIFKQNLKGPIKSISFAVSFI